MKRARDDAGAAQATQGPEKKLRAQATGEEKRAKQAKELVSRAARAGRKPKMRSVCESGELFDLTVASLNNPFGCLKDEWAKRCGAFQPIERYIEEYEMMLGGGAGADGGGGAPTLNDQLDANASTSETIDDKSAKRRARLMFLKESAKDPSLRLIFMCMSGYLNGAVFPGARDAGSQITTMVAHAQGLQEAGTSEEDMPADLARVAQRTAALPPAPFKMFFVGGNIILFFAFLLHFVFPHLHTRREQDLLSAAVELSTSEYSDLDYTLVPSTATEFLAARSAPGGGGPFPSIVPGRETLWGDGGSGLLDSGFFLMRAKTSFCYRHAGGGALKRTDQVTQMFKERGLFVSPQAFQHGMLGAPGLSPESVAFLKDLERRKESIAAETKLNVYVTAATAAGYPQAFFEARGPRPADRPGRIRAAINHLKAEQNRTTLPLMQYVHETVVSANAVIASWPRLSAVPDGGGLAGGDATTWKRIIGEGTPADTFYNGTLRTLYDVLTGPEDPSAAPHGGERFEGALQSVGRTALIPRMCASILIDFLNNDGRRPNANSIIDNIQKARESAGLLEDARPSPGKIIDVSRSPTLRVAAVEYLRSVQGSELPFPDQLNVTLNVIKTGEPQDCTQGQAGGRRCKARGCRKTRRRRNPRKKPRNKPRKKPRRKTRRRNRRRTRRR